MAIYKIFGPPGTGKTTALLNRVNTAIADGVDPKLIGYFAFTRQASREAIQRACDRFNLTEEDLPWFRTLHSFALRLSGIKTDQVMQKEHYKELGDALGMDLGGSKMSEPEDIEDLSKNNSPYINLINLARLKKIPLREQYNATNVNITWALLEYVDKALTNYKREMNLYDFTDMLELFVKERICPPLVLSFIDEAQDLSPLQWDVAHIIEQNSERTICAGDDDQAIYRWAGADVEHFIALDGGSEVLNQSYRVPASVHAVAERVAGRIKRRVKKIYKPKEDPGSVYHIPFCWDLDFSEGSWLVLAQSGYMLSPVISMLKDRGYLFEHRGTRSISEKISSAVNGWHQLKNGGSVTGQVVRNIYSFMSTGKRIERGFKKTPGIESDELYNLDFLIENMGLMEEIDLFEDSIAFQEPMKKSIREAIWSDAMDKLPERERVYITAMLRRGEKFNASPRIKVSTIHGSKGGEADNVALFTDLSPAAEKDSRNNPDDVHRVFYVGVTRTRKNLFLVDPQDADLCYNL